MPNITVYTLLEDIEGVIKSFTERVNDEMDKLRPKYQELLELGRMSELELYGLASNNIYFQYNQGDYIPHFTHKDIF